MPPPSLTVIGMISGTSVDAIDTAAARFSWEGQNLVLETLGHREIPWPADTKRRLLAALPPAPVTLAEICALDILTGEAFAAAAVEAQRDLANGTASLIASHGQNVFHLIENGQARGTLQIGQPAIIAEATGLPVISDLRSRDIAAGGQGAPLASTMDALWLASTDGPRIALNLGGIANITVVSEPGTPVIAYDTGPASCLLDIEAARITQGALACDLDGELALAGEIRPDLMERLLAEPYYARLPPKSTGRELFQVGYTDRLKQGLPTVSDVDLMATLTALTATIIARECHRHRAVEVLASGGGVRNPALMTALRQALGHIRLETSERRGMPSDAKEAYLFALLGYLSWHGLPGTVAGATGARALRILGRINPGNAPLVLPAPREMPERLLIRAGTA